MSAHSPPSPAAVAAFNPFANAWSDGDVAVTVEEGSYGEGAKSLHSPIRAGSDDRDSYGDWGKTDLDIDIDNGIPATRWENDTDVPSWEPASTTAETSHLQPDDDEEDVWKASARDRDVSRTDGTQSQPPERMQEAHNDDAEVFDSDAADAERSTEWLKRFEQQATSDEVKQVLTSIKNLLPTWRASSTGSEDALESAKEMTASDLSTMSKLLQHLNAPLPKSAASLPNFQDTEIFRLGKAALLSAESIASRAVSSARDHISRPAPSNSMFASVQAGEPEASTSASPFQLSGLDASRFAPVSLPSPFTSPSPDIDILALQSELGVPVRNLDALAADANATPSLSTFTNISKVNTPSVNKATTPAATASRWSFFSRGEKKQAPPPTISPSSSSPVRASQEPAEARESVDRRASSSSSMREGQGGSSRPGTPFDPNRGASGEANSRIEPSAGPSRFWKYGKDRQASGTSPAAGASNDSAPAPAASTSTTSVALFADDLSQLENFHSRRPSAASLPGTSRVGPSTKPAVNGYGNGGMSSVGMGATGSKDSDLLAELEAETSESQYTSSKWAFWNRTSQAMPIGDVGRPRSPIVRLSSDGGSRGRHAALGGATNVVQHEPDIDELFEAFAQPPGAKNAQPDEIFDGSVRAMAKAAPDLSGLEDPYGRPTIASDSRLPSKKAANASSAALSSFDPLAGVPPPIRPKSTPNSASTIPTLVPPTSTTSSLPKPRSSPIPPLLAPPPPGLRKVSAAPMRSLIDDSTGDDVPLQKPSTTPVPSVIASALGSPQSKAPQESSEFGDFASSTNDSLPLSSEASRATSSPSASKFGAAPELKNGPTLSQQDLSFFDAL